MRILLIEDDKKIAAFVEKGLIEARFFVDVALDGENGLKMAENADYNLVILDIMLPKCDGLSVLEALRQRGIQTPIIILSARESVDDKVKGLQLGCDDYIAKPFSFIELLARVQAQVRRGALTNQSVVLKCQDLQIDLRSRKVKRGNTVIDLHAKEFMLLEYLMTNLEVVVTKTQILEKVWGYDFDPQTNVVDVLVCRLRNKVDKAQGEKLIHTIRGVGYVLKKS